VIASALFSLFLYRRALNNETKVAITISLEKFVEDACKRNDTSSVIDEPTLSNAVNILNKSTLLFQQTIILW